MSKKFLVCIDSDGCAFDTMEVEGVVGSLAGDDTIFVLMRSETTARDVAEEIKQYLSID